MWEPRIEVQRVMSPADTVHEGALLAEIAY
jgi:phage baseplate assembly protein W